LLAELREAHPALREWLPLTAGVEEELYRRYPEEKHWRLVAALRQHTSDPRYLEAAATDEMRYDLDGNPAEVNAAVDPEYAGAAAELLEQLREHQPALARFLPLASGVDRQLVASEPGAKPWRVIAALRQHVHDPRYLSNVIDEEWRFDLQLQAVEPVVEADRAFSRQLLEALEAGAQPFVGRKQSDPAAEAFQRSQELIGRVLEHLRNRHDVLAAFLPLASGVDKELLGAHPELPHHLVIAALRHHVAEPDYLTAVAEGAWRYSLADEPVQPITPEEQSYSAARLREVAADAGDEPGEERD
jgi:ProP effector